MRKERKSTAHTQPTVFEGWCLAASVLVFTKASMLTKVAIPLLHFNSPPDFVASKLVQKVLHQCYQFLFLQDFAELY